jgi:hypothetical protein
MQRFSIDPGRGNGVGLRDTSEVTGGKVPSAARCRFIGSAFIEAGLPSD